MRRQTYPQTSLPNPTWAALAVVLFFSVQYVVRLSARTALVEQAIRDLDNQKARREWWLTKGIPAIAGIGLLGTGVLSVLVATGTLK